MTLISFRFLNRQNYYYYYFEVPVINLFRQNTIIKIKTQHIRNQLIGLQIRKYP